jgi:hypothetical protein
LPLALPVPPQRDTSMSTTSSLSMDVDALDTIVRRASARLPELVLPSVSASGAAAENGPSSQKDESLPVLVLGTGTKPKPSGRSLEEKTRLRWKVGSHSTPMLTQRQLIKWFVIGRRGNAED